MKISDRQARRMLERMGVDIEPIQEVKEVIIRTSSKDIIIKNPNVSEMKAKGVRVFQVMGESIEERVIEAPKFTEEDILLVAQQANVSREVAANALAESNGDLAKAILKLTS
ncbi:MAG: nascent polypeptide-associated complex protein [archaeon]|nr:nascent polypeptide-associated complex protein [archaeon]MCP8316180.1 nascent polypeptide-associated complex protein [archaeon]